jgi:outer membrane protein TolC
MRTLLAAKLDAAKVLGQRQTTAVQLIKALGGGWHERELWPPANGKPASGR